MPMNSCSPMNNLMRREELFTYEQLNEERGVVHL